MPKGGCNKCKEKKLQDAPLNICSIVDQAHPNGLALGLIKRGVSPSYRWWKALEFTEIVTSAAPRVTLAVEFGPPEGIYRSESGHDFWKHVPYRPNEQRWQIFEPPGQPIDVIYRG